jgi:hypothetical protein
MRYEKFTIAFWHPFGPHGREMPDEIIARKRTEIEANGWTLWSFQHRLILDDWRKEIIASKANAVFVFAPTVGSRRSGQNGMPNTPIDCRNYRFVNENEMEWRPMPVGGQSSPPVSPREEIGIGLCGSANHLSYRRIPTPAGRVVLSIERPLGSS